MTNLEIACPHCNTKLGVPTSYAGREIKCKKCQKRFRVPSRNANIAPAGELATKSDTPDSTLPPPAGKIDKNSPPPPVVNDPPPIVPPPIKTEPPEISPPPVIATAPPMATAIEPSPPAPPSDGPADSPAELESQVQKSIEQSNKVLPAKADDPELFPPGFAPSIKSGPSAKSQGQNDGQTNIKKKKEAAADPIQKNEPSAAVTSSDKPPAEMQPTTTPSKATAGSEKRPGDPKRKPRRSNKKTKDAPKSKISEDQTGSPKGRWKTTGKEKTIGPPSKPIPTPGKDTPVTAPPTNAPPTNAPATNTEDPKTVVENLSEMAKVIGSEVIEPNLSAHLSEISTASPDLDVHPTQLDPAVTNPAPNDPVLDLLLSKLPPKFLDPDAIAKKKNVVRLPDADGGFIELDGDVTKVSFRGTKFDVKTVDSTSTRLMRLVWRMMVFVVCAALLMLAYYLLTWS